MRVAAGVILIFAAVFNLFGSFAYLAGGAMIGGADKFTSIVEEQRKKQGGQLTEDEKRSFAQMKELRTQKRGSAGALAGFGVFLLVTVGTSIAGAVCLFRRKAAKFVIVAAALAIAAEVLSWVIFTSVLGVPLGAGKIVLSIPGLLGGVFAILGARQIQAMNAAPAAMPPPAAAAM
ncbi:MAG TPA: hypothetical protein VIF57_11105 [Polyangia bacterium]|jgi:hypothetical protein